MGPNGIERNWMGEDGTGRDVRPKNARLLLQEYSELDFVRNPLNFYFLKNFRIKYTQCNIRREGISCEVKNVWS